jgi:hypothetical protein
MATLTEPVSIPNVFVYLCSELKLNSKLVFNFFTTFDLVIPVQNWKQ